MAATTNMNIILGQGNAVNEVHNVKKQNLEMNQQFVAQETDGKKKEDKTKVQKFEAADKVAIQEDEEKKDHRFLGTILQSLGYITRNQIIEILEAIK